MKAGDFEHAALSPGFNVFVYPTDKFKSSSVMMFLHRPLDRQATHLSVLESVLQRGCRGFPTMRSISMFQDDMYGASFDTDVLKIGERQILTLSMRILNDKFAPKKVNALQRSLDFMGRVLSEPLRENGKLRKDFVDQEKVNLRRFLEGMINDRMGYAMLRCTQVMCDGEPYGIQEYGSLDEIPRVSPESLTDFHHRLLSESPIDVFVAGDHSAAQVIHRVEKRFKKLIERKAIAAVPAPQSPPPRARREIQETIAVEQAKLVMGFRTGRTLTDPQFPALAFFNGIFGSYPHSRLFADLREKQGLCYQAHSFVEATKGLLFVVLGIDAAKFEQARDSVLKHIEDLRAGHVQADEYDKTRELIIHAIRAREDSPRSKIFSSLEGIINGRIWSSEEIMKAVLSVRKEDVAPSADRLSLDTVYLLKNP